MTIIKLMKKEGDTFQLSFNKKMIEFNFNDPQISNDQVMIFFTSLSNFVIDEEVKIIDEDEVTLMDENYKILVNQDSDNNIKQYFICELVMEFVSNFHKQYNLKAKEYLD